MTLNPVHLRARTSRADLLCALQWHACEWLPCPQTQVHDDWGYALSMPLAEAEPEQRKDDKPQPPLPQSQIQPHLLPLKMPLGFLIQTRQDNPNGTPTYASEQSEIHEVEVKVDPRPTSEGAQKALEEIDRASSSAPMRGPLRRALAHAVPVSRRIDWRAVVRQCARLKPLVPLPRIAKKAWPGHLNIVLDAQAQSLEPFHVDFEKFVGLMRRTLGAARIRVHRLRTLVEPLQAGRHWPGRNETGGTWLLLSDAGIFNQVRSHGFENWFRAMAQSQHVLLCLAPLPLGGLLALPMPAWASTWQGQGRVVRTQAREVPGLFESTESSYLSRLMSLLAMCGQTSSLLLRAWRLRLAPNDPSLEWLVWNHPHVQTRGPFCEIKTEHLTQYLCGLSQLQAEADIDWLQAMHQIRRCLQAGTHPADEHLAVLRAFTLVPQLIQRMPQQWQEAIAYFDQWSKEAPGLQGSARNDRNVKIQRCIVKCPESVLRMHQERFKKLAQVALADELRTGAPVPVWAGLGALQVASDLIDGATHSEDATAQTWALVQAGANLQLLPDSTATGGVLVKALGPATGNDAVWVSQGSQARSIQPLGNGVDLPMDWRQSCELNLGSSQVHINPIQRPDWAHEFAQTPEGLVCQVVLPTGLKISLDPEQASQSQSISGHGTAGLDQYGLYWDGWGIRGLPTQRFRYIPPGTFLMGSPDGVGDSDEHPQHPVTLTEGFWLADTPCTQALWLAVIGSNPSHFGEGSDALSRPVESVEFDDPQKPEASVKVFLQRLQAALPAGVQASLPTEAQWEYACRAGTRTAYWWGDEWDDHRGNVDEKNKGTTPVDKYPPNPWGLHDMHGNVWEWCMDEGRRGYAAQAEADPLCLTEPGRRVLRGGSWIIHPGRARSAYRYGGLVDGRDRGYGFRLLLRSSSTSQTGQAASRPEGGA